MPIHEFRCNGCGNTFEKLILRQNQQVRCPGCDQQDVKRLISACSFGSSDGSVKDVASSGCASCTATSCSSCSGG